MVFLKARKKSNPVYSWMTGLICNRFEYSRITYRRNLNGLNVIWHQSIRLTMSRQIYLLWLLGLTQTYSFQKRI